LQLIYDIIFNPVFMAIFLFFIAMFLMYAKVTDMNLKERAISISTSLIIKRIRKDEEAHLKNKQMDLLGLNKDGFAKKYRDLVQSILISLKLTMFKVENFTSFIVFMMIIIATVFSIVFDSIIIGIMFSVPCVIAFVAMLTTITRSSIRANDNRVMDALDIICPAIDNSVNAAIRGSMDGFDPKIKPKFQDFLDNQDARNMLFREAVAELKDELGPRATEFVKKALMFYETGDEGMNEIFMDIVELNSLTRSINAKSDEKFKEQNYQLIGSSTIILLFLGFAMTNSLTGELLRTAFIGKLIAVTCISLTITAFAAVQIIQMTINYDKLTE